MKISADRLIAGCSDAAFDNGITVHAELEPLAGPGAPVKPAVYAGGHYQLERRWLGEGEERRVVDAISIDNPPSQANRLEAALERLAPSVGLPRLELDISGHPHLPPHIPPRLSGFRFPHRNADSYLRDSELDGVSVTKTKFGKDLFAATAQSPLALIQHFPHALLFGFWQSHMGKKGPQTKLARSWTSEIIGFEPGSTETRRLGLKGDPLNLTVDDGIAFSDDDHRDWDLVAGKAKAGSKSKDSLAEVGHGQVPVSGSDAPLGAVSFRSIAQTASVSLASLRNIGTGDDAVDAPLRALLVAIGVLGHVAAFGRGFNLRSTADLVPATQTWTWMGEDANEELDTPTIGEAKVLFADCVAAAGDAGLPVGDWATSEIRLTPNAALLKVLAQTFPEYEL